ncbi:Gfo/Idh/MocA family protein [Glaciibacter superstes]|uniref:Gfo/Idh/MocA family protein n=1 Tax=Glaciibacter superstes TaxID=501023 RepID=UPI0003FF058F|nr:Gfo/Idh/MocA family oxidoreductase [Glaciibacter superstes]
MKKLRLGVVGFGNRGVIAHRALAVDPDLEVVVSADPGATAKERARATFGADVALVDTVQQLIDIGVDAAFVTTPDYLHHDAATALLRAGVAVFVDKPLAITLEQADDILQAAYDTKTKLYVGHNMRHMPVIRIMKDLVDEGAVGEVKAVWVRNFVGEGGDRFFKDWHADRSKVNSLVLQKGSHDIDIAHWLAGSYTTRVTAMGSLSVYGQITDRTDRTGQVVREWISSDNWPPLSLTGLNPVIDVEDISMLTMQLANGAFASYQECHYTPDYWRNFTIIGTEGRIENFGLEVGGSVRLWNKRTVYEEHGHREIPIPLVEGGHSGADPALLAEFIRFVREGGVTETSPVAAREAVATGALAADSLRHGSVPRDVPPLPADLIAYFEAGQPA